MKQIPILMSTPMVQAILRGECPKTETRRLRGLDEINKHPNDWIFKGIYSHGPFGRLGGKDASFSVALFQNNKGVNITVRNPYGLPGDILWVREAWAKVLVPNGTTARELITMYKANSESKYDKPANGWKPSIHMPYEACRIFLEIKQIRCERLDDITRIGAVREGATHHIIEEIGYKGKPAPELIYKALWIHLNGQQSWNKNPWVWVVEFSLCKTPPATPIIKKRKLKK